MLLGRSQEERGRLMPMSVAAIIVAAGASSRFGQPKQLVLIDGEPLLQRAVRCAVEAGAAPVFVVLGAHREVIQSAIDFGVATVLVNDDWEEGMASSIRRWGQGRGDRSRRQCGRAADDVRSAAGYGRASAGDDRAIRRAWRGRCRSRRSMRGHEEPRRYFRERCSRIFWRFAATGVRAGCLTKASLPVVEIQLEGGEVDIDRPEDLAELG